MGNCGMIAGAFSSTSGKADIVLTTSGDVLYYTSSRQRLAIGDEGQVLTVSDADLPAWEDASGGDVTATSTTTFSNKTINASNNTLSNIANSSTLPPPLTNKTLSGDLITSPVGSPIDYYNLTPETGTSDNCDGLDTNTVAGRICVVKIDEPSDTVTVRSGQVETVKFELQGDASFTMAGSFDAIMLMAQSTITMHEVSRSKNES